MGPNFDPFFDAHLGRRAATSEAWPAALALASGYIELHGEHPWMDLWALLETMHHGSPGQDAPGQRLFDADGRLVRLPAWGLLAEIRYLVTDADCGIAMPMNDFMPPTSGQDRSEAFRLAVERLDALTKGRLRAASNIDLAVVFNFDAIGPALRRALSSGAGPLHERTDMADPFSVVVAESLSARALGSHNIGLAERCRQQLGTSITQLGSPQTPGQPLSYGITQTGLGTIVGIVDFGCDFAHPSFRTGANRENSRILALWDQNDLPGGAPPVVTVDGQDFQFGHGRLFTRAAIDAVLAKLVDKTQPVDPYADLQYDPHANHCSRMAPGASGGPPGAHGTFVMEIAAGGTRAVGPPVALEPRGVAPDADIVFVQVRPDWHGDRRGMDLNDVLEAIAFVFHVADREKRPCVVNVSLNTMSGPHDGDSHFDRKLSKLLRSGGAGPAAVGRAVVIAAGNLPDSATQPMQWQHLSGVASVGTGVTLNWLIAPQDSTLNSIQIWYDTPGARLQLTLVAPDGTTVGPVGPDQVDEETVAGVYHHVSGSRSRPDVPTLGIPPPPDGQDRQVMVVALELEVQAMQMWQLIVEVAPNAQALPPAGIRFDAWLERDDDGPSGLCRHSPPQGIDAQDLACSLGTLSCSRDAIVVGAYTAYFGSPRRWGLSGNGPNRRSLNKPDVAAPGHFMTLVRSRQGDPEQAAALANGSYATTGTSFAAPFVTGVIACAYELNPHASLANVQAALTQTAVPLAGDPPWTPDLGFGRLDPAGVLTHVSPS